MRFYAADNDYGTASSRGFANTWFVVAFDSKSARDKWVSESNNLTRKAIKKSEVTEYAANYSLTQNRTVEPRPFTGEFWGVDPFYIKGEIDGALGVVVVCDASEPCDRLY